MVVEEEEEEGVVLIFVPASGDRIDRYIWAIGETGRQRRVCENITGGGHGRGFTFAKDVRGRRATW